MLRNRKTPFFGSLFSQQSALIKRHLGAFRPDRAGTIAVKFALVFPILAAVSGVSVDYISVLRQKTTLQSAADAASMAAARELSLSDAKRENVTAVVSAVFVAYLRANENKKHSAGVATATATIRDNPLEIDVTAKQAVAAPFGLVTGFMPNEVTVRSVARVVGRPNICVLGLNPSENGTISLEHQARVTGNNCAVFSNSSHVMGIKAKNSAVLKASFICTRGGRDGGPGSFEPTPLTDCPSFEDPLGSRPEPSVGTCTSSEPTVVETSQDLLPGTYCGGLTIRGAAVVTLRPGIYIIKDGPLVVTDNAKITGTEAGFFFTGTGTGMTFDSNTSISLSAPKSGTMAGLLIFGSRTANNRELFRILSNDARTLVGTIYLPKGELHIDASQPVADSSAYTAIVADVMRLYGGPHLVLNTNYGDTDVPVPTGIKGAGQPAALVK
ncbi:MAG: pilus assembly protein [Hyphomicrobiaceae bacterium]|nr:pilus assembly protein [Hyphomicrobiaceae bacterium]